MKRPLFIIIISILFLVSATNIQTGLPVVSSAKAGILDELPGPKIMPDSSFYFLKVWYEKIITFLSFGDLRKAERYSKLAERRLYEAKKMAEKGKGELTKQLLKEYEKVLNNAFKRAEKLKKEAEEKAKQELKERANQVLEKVSESTLENQKVLLKIYELVPDEAKQTIEKVIEITKIGYERAVDAVSGIKKEELKQRIEDIKEAAKELIKGWQRIFGD